MKEKLSLIGSFLLVGFILAAPFLFPQKVATDGLVYEYPLSIGTESLVVAHARTPEELKQGLSGTEELEENTGMLFFLLEEEIPAFWMKDMNYPIDIIWIGSDKLVRGVSENVRPESFPQTFSPQEPVSYVLEVPAGFVEEHSIYIGTLVAF